MAGWSSPCLLIRKPCSKNERDMNKAQFCICTDLRGINENSVHLRYSLLHLQEALSEIETDKKPYYSLLDISDAFYQIQLHPDSYKYTTFKIHQVGNFCLKRLPQGYVGSPSIFQAVIEHLFPEHIKPYLTMYLDDILITTATAKQHIYVIKIVLFTLRQHGMKLKIQKCHICPKELNFLGHTLTSKG